MNPITSTIVYSLVGIIFLYVFYKAYKQRHGHRDLEKETPGDITIEEIINQF